MQYVYEETNRLDERCYKNFDLTPEILMEHAGLALARAVKKKLTCKKSALFVCGMGNNGADGIVAARLLHGMYHVSLYLPYELKSELAKRQLERAKKVGVVVVNELVDADIYIDALFGAGLNRPLDDLTCKLLETLNAKQGYKIACDIPSGILNDLTLSPVIFKANETVTMGALKLALLNDTVKDAIGDIKVANLGIARNQYETPSSNFLLRKSDLKLPLRIKKKQQQRHFWTRCHCARRQRGRGTTCRNGRISFWRWACDTSWRKAKKIAYLSDAQRYTAQKCQCDCRRHGA
ncbi:bifunctional NAD(P)H-hydrate repair enzyme Nnr [Sulfurospirillum multivorans]|uniref:NAD(P)H-hydrate epimerase n=1 Tax=Sulfurospirillum multivorans TaxID=66821 RepID=A0ABX5Z7T3_SULMU|nr:bifunctional NAD(P)H-hydrate repair enzyme Nnr [Sulfurospirillum multivorans]